MGQNQDMKADAGWLVFGLVLGGIAFATTGCLGQVNSKGWELYGSVGHRAIDEHEQSQKTLRDDRPLICKVWGSLERCQGGQVEAIK